MIAQQCINRSSPPILDEDKDIKETHDCNCFDNMMDASHPVDAAKSQLWVSSISL
jgi:hypothetical protein